MKRRIGLRGFAGLTAVAAATALAVTGIALGVSGAVSTTDNPGHEAPTGYIGQACLNGTGVNCNIYLDKRDVWFSGLPVSAAIGEGTYFFAVLSPGGQPAPNDDGTNNANGALANLSDDVDAYTNRTFSVDGDGNITSYSGTHERDGNLLQLFDYADTPNPGGVYILAVCSLAGGYPVAPHDCKYDAFKVKAGECQVDCGPPPADDLTVQKDAIASFSRRFNWGVVKTVDGQESVNYNAASKTLNYQVVYTKSLDSEFGFNVHDTITVTNPNDFDVTGVDVADTLDDGTGCTVDDGTYTDGNGDEQTVAATDGTIPALTAVEYQYSCSPDDASATKNTATASWDESNGLPHTSADGSADVTWSTTLIHDCVNASDTIPAGNIVGSPPAGLLCDSTTFNYTKSVTIANACTTVNNTAAFVDPNDSSFTGSDSTTAQICGPITNGFTLGYWSNNNGRATLCANDPGWRNTANASYLRKANGQQFTVSLTKTCPQAHADFATWILAATATNMSNMLSAQLIATTYDVAYKGMLGTACIAGIDGNPISINNLIAAAVAFLAANPVTVNAGPARTTATLYKNIFDKLNNNLGFAVPGPC